MRAAEIEVGGVYKANVSGKRVCVRVERIEDCQDINGRFLKSYVVVNFLTHRYLRFRSAQRFLCPVSKDTPNQQRAKHQAALWGFSQETASNFTR